MAVMTYYKKQLDLPVSDHFTLGDFWACDEQEVIKMDSQLFQLFEDLYAHFGAKPRLRNRDTAGYRDSVNWTGSKTSQHCYGKAVDVEIPGVAAYQLAQFAETLDYIGGIGLYLPASGGLKKVTHIHADTRPRRTLWGWNFKTSGTSTPGFGGVPCSFKLNNKSAAIEELQITLNAKGFPCGKPDGVYGAKTRDSVKAFQLMSGLKADGVFGPQTNEKLELFHW